MPRRPTGQVIEPKDGRAWALRFRAYGKRRYVRLGTTAEGWSRPRAEAELRHVLADVERGRWQPYRPAPVEAPPEMPTFHEFASEWLAGREPELRKGTVESYRWQLCSHLLPAFAEFPLDAIRPQDVDRYKAATLRAGRLGANQINKTLATLRRILETARRYGHIDRNPLDDVDRLRPTKPFRPALDPEQLPTLLDAAGSLRPIIATLAGTGLRDGEACALNWGDVNLASGTLTIRAAKTAAGIRRVDMPIAIRGELKDHKIRSEHTGPDDPVFTTRRSTRENVSNLGRRLKTVLRRADTRLLALGLPPIGSSVTPYSFRRLYASLRYALGDDPVYVAEQMGHADGGGLSMATYASALRHRSRLTGVTLREYDRALDWAAMGSVAPEPAPRRASDGAAATPEDRLLER